MAIGRMEVKELAGSGRGEKGGGGKNGEEEYVGARARRLGERKKSLMSGKRKRFKE